MRPQSHEHGQETRRRLMEAALLAFAEKGFDGAGVREIAQRADVNQAMIAYHFGGKDGLYEAAMRWACEDFSRRVQGTIDAACAETSAGDALEGIRAIVGGLFRSVAICNRGEDGCQWRLHEAAHRLWSQEMVNPRAALLDFVMEQVRVPMDRIHACIETLRPGLSWLEMDTMLISIHGAMLTFHKHFGFIEKTRGVPYSDEDIERMVDYFVDFCVRGLGVLDAVAIEGK